MKIVLLVLSIALMCMTSTAYAKQSQCVWMNGAYQCHTPHTYYNRYNQHQSWNPNYYQDRHRHNNGWSDGEKIIAGLLVINALASQSSKSQPVYDSYRAGAEARRMEEQRLAQERAYMCGYTGTCKP